MVYDCISEKLSELKEVKHTTSKGNTTEINDLKLKIKAIEKSEKQLMDTMLTGGSVSYTHLTFLHRTVSPFNVSCIR